jgi:hypothetical protein
MNSVLVTTAFTSTTIERELLLRHMAIMTKRRRHNATLYVNYVVNILVMKQNKTLNIPFVYFLANPHTNTRHNKLPKLIYMNKGFG